MSGGFVCSVGNGVDSLSASPFDGDAQPPRFSAWKWEACFELVGGSTKQAPESIQIPRDAGYIQIAQNRWRPACHRDAVALLIRATKREKKKRERFGEDFLHALSAWLRVFVRRLPWSHSCAGMPPLGLECEACGCEEEYGSHRCKECEELLLWSFCVLEDFRTCRCPPAKNMSDDGYHWLLF